MARRGRRRADGAPSPPRVQIRPGLGADLRAELAPLLADEGIDIDNLGHVDARRLQEALNKAAERINLVRFTPIGAARSLAASRLREAVDALAAGERAAAFAVLGRLQPESPEEPTVAACIGVSLSLLDDWHSTEHAGAPDRLGERVVLRMAHDEPETVAAEVISLAHEGQAFASLGALVTRNGGESLLFACVIALCTVVQVWSAESHRSVARVLLDHLR
jgi:hypothetical protein